MTAQEFYKVCATRLADVLGAREAEATIRAIFEDVAGYSRKWLFMNGDREITDFMQSKINAIIARVEAGEPVQYAVGKARFMGMSLVVSPAVLIPRPETEGLVDGITDWAKGRHSLKILDIGTGSACIAIALARALPFSEVTALDISAEALAVAKQNAKNLNVDIEFVQADILSLKPEEERYDIIVSNPPYICDAERVDMEQRVLDYEPSTALFVPDSEALLFYRAIAIYAKTALKPGGALFFEINRRFPKEVCKLLIDNGFNGAVAERDYLGNYRYVRAIK